MSTSAVIEKIVTDFDIVQKEFQGKAQTALKSAFKEFFDGNPRVSQIYWTQYTPHFNDGDECTFSVHEMYGIIGSLTKKGDEDEYIDDREDTFDSGGKYGDEEFNSTYANEIANFKNFTRLINRLPDAIFEATFGNHVEVKATRDGFDVEEYNHD